MLGGMLKERDGKVSAARVNLASAILAFWLVFLVWLVVVLGLFFDVWPWERFDRAIVAGGIGLLGVIFGGVGGYAVNKFKGDRWRDE